MGLYFYRNGVRHATHWTPQESVPDSSKGKKLPYGAAEVEPPRPKPAVTLRDIMRSPVLTLGPDSTLQEAMRFIRIHRFRHVPVLDQKQRLIGLVSDRDLLREASRTEDSLLEWVSGESSPGRKISSFMTRDVLTGTADTLIREAAQAMLQERIGSLPVLDAKERLIGIVTRTDILRTIVAQAPLELWI